MTKQEITMVINAKKGKKNAFEKLCETYRCGLSNLIVNATGDKSRCDEILSAVFQQAKENLPGLSNPADFEPMVVNLVLAQCGHDYTQSVPTTIQSDASFSASHPQEEFDPDKATYDYRSSVYAPEFSSIEPDAEFDGFMTFFETGRLIPPTAEETAAIPEESIVRTQVFATDEETAPKTLVIDGSHEEEEEEEDILPEFKKPTCETLEMIKSRRSVKSFSDKPVPKKIIDAVIEAGLYAPSGMGKQSPIIVAVTEQKTRDRLSQLNSRYIGADIDPFYGAPAVLVVLADRNVPTYLYDGSLTMGNMLLAAHALGIGGCWIHRAKQVFDSPEGKEILKSLGIEGDYEGIGDCVLGYPADDPKPAAERKPNRVYYI